MPLPEPNSPWPPPAVVPVYEQIGEWAAWFSGNREELSAFYGGQQDTSGHDFFASQAGGFIARVRRTIARWFWGTATPAGEQRAKLHLPVAGDIATTSADLLFGEPPTILVADQSTQGELDDMLDQGMIAELIEAAEVTAALGGVYLKVRWDSQISPRPWLEAVHADAALPEFAGGRLAAVTFWQVLASDGSKVVRHLERHEKGRIEHAVYEGTINQLGRLVPLGSVSQTEGLGDLPDQETAIVETGVPDRLTAVYWPNVRPNRCWRNLAGAARLGRSDYQGVEPFMDALDEAYTSWLRDIDLGKGRIIVPDNWLVSQGPGKGAVWESERKAFIGMPMLEKPTAQGALPIEVAQFEIRMEQHKETCSHWLRQILRGAGYAAQTFGEVPDGGGERATATEIRAEQRRSFLTRDRKIRYARPQLQEVIETLLMVYAARGGPVAPERPQITFGDSISDSLAELAETATMLRQAEAASTETIVRTVHPDWDDKAVAEEVAAIEGEREAAREPLLDPETIGQTGQDDDKEK